MKDVLARFDVLEKEMKTLKNENKQLTLTDKKVVAESRALKKALIQSESENATLRMIIDKQSQEIARLNSIINNNHTNSGLTTAQTPFSAAPVKKQEEEKDENEPEKKPANHFNGRRHSEKKKGGQPGHKGHRRTHSEPDVEITLDAPEEVQNNPTLFEEVSERVHYQTDLVILPITIAFSAPIFKNIKTGKLLKTPFPANLQNEANYGPVLKSIVYLMGQFLNVSVGKIHEFLFDVTDGELNLSTGTISNMVSEFAKKSLPEQQEIITSLMEGKYLGHDLTYIKINGKNAYSAVSVNEDTVHYQFVPFKGYMAMENSPIKEYTGPIVHDADPAYGKYGNGEHQQCLIHVSRRLRKNQEIEKDIQWHKEMEDFLGELMHQSKSGNLDSEDSIKAAEKRFNEIVEKGLAEYGEKTPVPWYKAGKRLVVHMKEHPSHYLYFLRHPEVPSHNNGAEQAVRQLKRKTKQAEQFGNTKRAKESLAGLSVVQTARKRKERVVKKVQDIFKR
jgi:hypothetical protein